MNSQTHAYANTLKTDRSQAFPGPSQLSLCLSKGTLEGIWVGECILYHPPTVCCLLPVGTAADKHGKTAYLVHALGVLQPGIVHLLNIIRTCPIEEGLGSDGRCVAPDVLKRPWGARRCRPRLRGVLSRL